MANKILSPKSAIASRGFTIVELLIVIVVIAILAAITIVSYNGISNRAKVSAAQTTAQQALTKIQVFSTSNSDLYPADLATVGLSGTDSTNYQYTVDNTAKTFCLTATTQNISYYVSSTITVPTAGACAGHDLNGIAAITNLVNNPRLTNTGANYGSAGSTVGSARTAISDLSGFAWAWSAGTSAASDRIFVQQNTPALTIGSTYTASFWAKGTAGASLAAQATDSGGSSYLIGSTFTATGSWQRIGITFVPTGTTWRIAIRQQSAITGNLSMTGAMLTAGSTQYNFADGSSSGWIWNGTADNSSSTGVPL